MSLPKEPRQKMINMMYLVLTALLALNVSSEILNAFKTVNNSLITSNGIIDGKSQTLLASLQQKLSKPETHDKAAIWKPKALQAKGLSDAMNAYIAGLEDSLKREAGYNPPTDTTYREDNLEASTRLLVEHKKGEELRDKLGLFKQQLLDIDPELKTEFAKTLPIDTSLPKTQNSNNTTWSEAYFHMTPTIAALTILSKFQNDVKNSEAQVVEFCHKKVGEVEVVFDQYQPLIGTSANYLMPGQELVIDAGIGAYSKAVQPQVSIDGAGVAIKPEGYAEYKTNVGGPGSYSKKVHISFFNQALGKQDFKEVEVKYTAYRCLRKCRRHESSVYRCFKPHLARFGHRRRRKSKCDNRPGAIE